MNHLFITLSLEHNLLQLPIRTLLVIDILFIRSGILKKLNVKRTILLIAIPLGLSSTLMIAADLRAGTDLNDSCRDAGYGNGREGHFSQETYDHCGDEEGGNDAYYEEFIDGCMSIEGNTKDVCESATDSSNHV
jgi:hypothetical protein